MKKLFVTLLVLSILTGSSLEEVGHSDAACKCDHCEEQNSEEIRKQDALAELPFNMEDSDGDGSRIICARDRDLEDKTFPSICHMLCENRCTRFNVTEKISGSLKRVIATAYRTNYYKLHDGQCL
ncbi:uncharacterized protein LOC124301780 [Neodiprion virginianus]|uniref:uncharacterized protein LOC124301780 n=1 Tax=Neodiprion virginianus TaxID=2961670 RepID=UPI001EE6ED7D|nr:uncharacterized protein LOC124301780 [Neodiprion virginianus]